MPHSTAHLNPFLHYPKTTAFGLAFLAFAALAFLRGTLTSTPQTDGVFRDLSATLAIVGLWTLLVVGVLVEPRQKYAALHLLIKGLFLITATVAAWPALLRFAHIFY